MGVVDRAQHNADVVGEAKVGVGNGSVYISYVSINMVHHVISPCQYGNMLIKP